MATLLVKGRTVSLSKGSSLKKIVVGLGWTTNDGSGAEFDLDASALLLRLELVRLEQ